MKEVTRIHIAKIAYDIEVAAKKELEKYTAALERYAGDAELLDDIEIRITELLVERSVQPGGVVTLDDVVAVREQLGEPSEFAPETASEAVAGVTLHDDGSRKLFRDRDVAMLGGVLAGVARFFRIQPVYIRLIFVVLLIGSFGTASLVYLLMWLVVPPARTAAEKLQMRGQSVTLDSIKRLGVQEEGDGHHQSAQMIRRTLRYIAGSLLALGALTILVVTAVIGSGMLLGFGTSDNSPFASLLIDPSWQTTVASLLFIASGLLLAVLGGLLAYTLFAARFTKRIALAVVAVVVGGILTFGAGVGMTIASASYSVEQAQEAMVVTKKSLPAEFEAVKKLSISAHSIDMPYGRSDLSIEYVVSPTMTEYELTSLPGLTPAIVVDGDTARVALKSNALHDRLSHWVQPRLVIRGPAMDEVVVEQGDLQYTANYPDGQRAARFETLPSTSLVIYGRIESVQLVGAGIIDASHSTITHLEALLRNGQIEAGVVRTLAVTQPDVCPAEQPGGGENELRVRAVSGGKISYNGSEREARTIAADCGRLIVGNEYESWEE